MIRKVIALVVVTIPVFHTRLTVLNGIGMLVAGIGFVWFTGLKYIENTNNHWVAKVLDYRVAFLMGVLCLITITLSGVQLGDILW